MALSNYEQEREARIAANKQRMEELQVAALAKALKATVNQKREVKRQQKTWTAAEALVDVPIRRSSRMQSKPAPNYSDDALDQLDGPKRLRAPVLREGKCEELYTQAHLDALGDYQQPWELFVDGYGADGNRVYDSVNGQTCHQCRQKTMGKRTSCSSCHSLQGVLCGDCLFMRYGENVEEAAANPDWVCPVCRDLCNCSNHRLRKGWLPTGSMYRKAIALGYRSVAHFIVLSKFAVQQAAAAANIETTAAAATSATATDDDLSQASADTHADLPSAPAEDAAACPPPQPSRRTLRSAGSSRASAAEPVTESRESTAQPEARPAAKASAAEAPPAKAKAEVAAAERPQRRINSMLRQTKGTQEQLLKVKKGGVAAKPGQRASRQSARVAAQAAC